MINKLLLKDFRSQVSLNHEPTGYTLIVDKKDPLKTEFHYPCVNSPYYSSAIKGTVMKVTARDLIEYPIREIGSFSNGMTILEFGPGLGEFIPSLAKDKRKRLNIVALDMANYDLMADILDSAIRMDLGGRRASSRLLELLRRCEIFLDGRKVEVFRKDIGEVIKSRELSGKIDLAVDLFGPAHYRYQAQRVSVQKSRKQIQFMLTNSGKFVCYPRCYSGRASAN